MPHQDTARGGPAAAPRRRPQCLDCGGQRGHAQTCPQWIALQDLLDVDLYWLDEHPDSEHVRRLHWCELAALEAWLGIRPPRRMRRGWAVRVRRSGPNAVVREVRDADGSLVAEFTDEPVGAA